MMEQEEHGRKDEEGQSMLLCTSVQERGVSCMIDGPKQGQNASDLTYD